MINSFGQEYTPAVIRLWLSRDPSLAWAIVAVVVVNLSGESVIGPLLGVVVPPFVLAFLPLSLWIWDIPGTGRWICRHCHDDLLALPKLGVVRTRRLYQLGALLFVLLLAAFWSFDIALLPQQ